MRIIYVKKEFRGQKIASKLLEFALKELRGLNCQYICTLIEDKLDESINFYLKNGFKKGINCIWLDKTLSKEFKN